MGTYPSYSVNLCVSINVTLTSTMLYGRNEHEQKALSVFICLNHKPKDCLFSNVQIAFKCTEHITAPQRMKRIHPHYPMALPSSSTIRTIFKDFSSTQN